MERDSDAGLYSIRHVSEATGLPLTTLRHWEKSYGLIRPRRTAGGHRLYSQDDIVHLKWLKRTIERDGVQASIAHELLARELAKVESVHAEASAKGAIMILVAEKDPITAELEEYFLTQEGFDVHVVLDGRIAIEKAEALQPDLIVLDVILPGLSGLKVCRALKDDPATAGIPVLVFSMLDVKERAIDAGADAFLLKPIDAPALIQAVRALLTLSPSSRRS